MEKSCCTAPLRGTSQGIAIGWGHEDLGDPMDLGWSAPIEKYPSSSQLSSLPAIPSLEVDPFEDPDWDYARAKKVMVRSPSVEWSSSVRSVNVEVPEFGSFVMPNRNMPVEGLLVLLQGELWKAIDGVGVSFDDSRPLKPSTVRYAVAAAQYRYCTDDGEALTVEYAAADAGVATSGGLRIGFSFPQRAMGDRINLYVLTDLRPLKRPPPPVDYYPAIHDGLMGSSSTAKLGVLSDTKLDSSSASRRELDWQYKMGYGFRSESERGIIFAREERTIGVLGPYGLTVSSPSHELLIVLSNTWPPEGQRRDAMRAYASTYTSHLEAMLSSLPAPTVGESVKEALFGRIAALLSFGVRPWDRDARLCGEAGSCWFREVWFRDVFEGLLKNMRTLALLGFHLFIRDQLDIAMEFADPNGMLPNNLAWSSGSVRPSYNSIDSTLLFHELLLSYADAFGDEKLLRRGLSLLSKFLRAAQEGRVAGARIVDGALLSLPNYSWADSRSDVDVAGIHLSSVPCRVPVEYLESMLSAGLSPQDVEAAMREPIFLMPEVQARLVLVLKRSKRAAESLGADAELLENLGKSSFESFRVDLMKGATGLPSNLVMFDRGAKRIDRTPSSMSFLALAVLRNYSPIDVLKAAYAEAESQLLVRRRMTRLGSGVFPFGLLVQKRACEPYLGDRQYHGCVVWPRDTPYLIDVMERLGLRDGINEVLFNNLDASVSEVIPFYMNELYSLPLGKNPSPSPATAEQLIPLKNPAQFWSMWVDPYLRWFVS